MKFLRSSIPGTAPELNLALEEFLYLNRKEDECWFLTYRNSPSVVIGRNQNPWQEANLPWCRTNKIPVIRRISGGGTVYHDTGNLNYTFILPRDEYNPDKYVDIAAETLRSLGLKNAVIQGQHSIWTADRKISGSAFALNGRTALLHGCILVNTDLKTLSAALHTPKELRVTKPLSISSVKAPVVNLADLLPSISPEELEASLHCRVSELWTSQEVSSVDMAQVQTLAEKYSSDAWNMGRPKAFSATLETDSIKSELEIEDSIIKSANPDFTVNSIIGKSLFSIFTEP